MTMKLDRLIWLLPIAFALHVAEEYLTGYPAYATEVSGHVMELPVFLGSNIAFIVIMALLARWAAKSVKPAALFWLLAWSAGNQFWNFAYHLAALYAHDRYSPGLITGALIYLPLSIIVWRAALIEKRIRPAALIGAIALGGLWMGTVAAIGIYHVGGI